VLPDKGIAFRNSAADLECVSLRSDCRGSKRERPARGTWSVRHQWELHHLWARCGNVHDLCGANGRAVFVSEPGRAWNDLPGKYGVDELYDEVQVGIRSTARTVSQRTKLSSPWVRRTAAARPSE